MPPKRIIKNNSGKSKPPTLFKPGDDLDDKETLEAELKFDQEIIWCMSQFEKILMSGKLPESKRQESIRAVSTLRKPNVSKIQKIQVMRQYFKDYKAKMQKEEDLLKSQAQLSFQLDEDSEPNKGKFVKKKGSSEGQTIGNPFMFNFKDPSKDLSTVTAQLDSIALNK